MTLPGRLDHVRAVYLTISRVFIPWDGLRLQCYSSHWIDSINMPTRSTRFSQIHIARTSLAVDRPDA